VAGETPGHGTQRFLLTAKPVSEKGMNACRMLQKDLMQKMKDVFSQKL